ncbi:UNVERIFIED_CONTAM: hypothetical protein K2H54_039728 [Gekko kuhli]
MFKKLRTNIFYKFCSQVWGSGYTIYKKGYLKAPVGTRLVLEKTRSDFFRASALTGMLNSKSTHKHADTQSNPNQSVSKADKMTAQRGPIPFKRLLLTQFI